MKHNYEVGQEVAIVQPPNSSRERVPYAIGKVVNVNGDEIVVEWEGDSAKFAGSTHRGLNWPSYYAETEISANPADIEHVKKRALDGKGGGE